MTVAEAPVCVGSENSDFPRVGVLIVQRLQKKFLMPLEYFLILVSPYSITCSFLNRPFPASFTLFLSFLQTVTENNCSIKVADDWIRTRVLWYRKRPRCQLCQNTTRLSLLFLWKNLALHRRALNRLWQVSMYLSASEEAQENTHHRGKYLSLHGWQPIWRVTNLVNVVANSTSAKQLYSDTSS